VQGKRRKSNTGRVVQSDDESEHELKECWEEAKSFSDLRKCCVEFAKGELHSTPSQGRPLGNIGGKKELLELQQGVNVIITVRYVSK
jgi:hypothetical protein